MQSIPFRLLQAINKVFRVVFSSTSAIIITAVTALSLSGLVLVFGSFGLVKLDQASGTNNRALLNKWSAAKDWPFAATKFYKIVALGHNIGFALYSEEQKNAESLEQLAIYLADRNQASESVHETIFRLDSKPGQSPTLSAQYRLYLQDQPVSDYNFEWNIDAQTNSLVWQRGSPNESLPFAFTGPANATVSDANNETKPKPQATAVQQLPSSTRFFFPFSKQLAEALKDEDKKHEDRSSAFVIDPLRATAQAISSYKLANNLTKAENLQTMPILLKLKNSLEAEFIASEQAEIEAVSRALSAEAVALKLFTNPQSESKDLAKLENIARGCMERQSEFQERIVKNLANIPYLLHRNASILKEVCNGAVDVAESFRQTKGRDSRAQVFSQKIRYTLAGHSQEIPRSMITSPLWPILFDDKKQALWTNSLRILIEEAELEQADVVKFEEERKVPVKMQVILSGRTLGTVVKGVIKNKKLNMEIQVEGAQDGNMLPESWTEFPTIQTTVEQRSDLQINTKKRSRKKGQPDPEMLSIKTISATSTQPYQLFNGRIVNDSVLSKINLVCQAFGGRAGIDLGNGPQSTSSQGTQSQTAYGWGAWDSNSRLLLLDLFLRKSLAQKSCSSIRVRVPAEMKAPAEKLVAAFESQIIQNMQEIQLTNSRYRYLTLVPGSYELYVNSLVSGEFLERFEFNVLETGELSNRAAKTPQDFTLRLTNSASAKVTEPNNTP